SHPETKRNKGLGAQSRDLSVASYLDWKANRFDISAQARADGSILLQPTADLGSYPARVTDTLEQWATESPDRILVTRRGNNGDWIQVTYAQALSRVRAYASGLAQL